MLCVRQPACSSDKNCCHCREEGPRLAACSDVSQQWCDLVRAVKQYTVTAVVLHMKQTPAGIRHRAARSASAASWRPSDSQCFATQHSHEHHRTECHM